MRSEEPSERIVHVPLALSPLTLSASEKDETHRSHMAMDIQDWCTLMACKHERWECVYEIESEGKDKNKHESE